MRKPLSVLTALALSLWPLAAPANEGHAHSLDAVLGTITKVEGDRLEVADPDGKSVSIRLARTTMYLKGAEEATKADLKPGLSVAVETADGKAGLEARVVRIGSADGAVWACPMHPEVTGSGPAKCPKCGMFLEKKKA
ncbi:MAG: heavy metal-binding domain-containing protein [Thermoanaerobaculia bacterium]